MATKMYEEINLTTQGGTELVIRPLTIKSLRAFMKKMEELNGEDITDEKGIDVMVDAAKIAIRQCNPDLENIEDLEDELDIPTVNKILEVSGGVKVDDPSLQPTQAA